MDNRLTGQERIWGDLLGAVGVPTAGDGSDLDLSNDSGDGEWWVDSRWSSELAISHSQSGLRGGSESREHAHVLCPSSGNGGSKDMRLGRGLRIEAKAPALLLQTALSSWHLKRG